MDFTIMAVVNSNEGYQTYSPDGVEIHIPIEWDHQKDIYTQLDTAAKQKQYYEDNGYVVIRNLIPQETCNGVIAAFEKEVKPHKGYIYRQTSSYPEKHVLSEHGYILNSIKHIQDMSRTVFPGFVNGSFEAITHANVCQSIKNLIDDDGIIVQTMLFEGNPSTPAHVDSYYLDSADKGRMVAIWIALEDIQPGAGRFFVYPGSHKLNLPDNAGEFEVTEHHPNYLEAIQNLLKQPGMKCHAPALKKGDVLFWNANTIHGSLQTSQPQYSRMSLTAHFIPASHDYILFQKVKVNLNLKSINHYPIHCPKDQGKLENRLQMLGLQYFPELTNQLRKCIIRFRMSKES
jgi:phytanoyl-CoA hydroxylase